MYEIGIPNTIHQLMGIFYRLGMWCDEDVTSFGKHCRKLFYYIYFVAFLLSVTVGAFTTNDNDESVYLLVISVILVVQAYRLYIILWRKKEFLLLVHQIGIYSTDDREEFTRIKMILNMLMKLTRCILIVLTMTCLSCGIVFPITTDLLIFNIAFPFDRNNSHIAFWMASVFLVAGVLCSTVCAILTNMIWYLLISISFQYKVLGIQLRNMGTRMLRSPNLKVSFAVQQQAFFKDCIAAIQTYDKINCVFEEFCSFFGNLFFIQVATGSVCICGSVYTLAFSSHGSLIKDAFYCVALTYSFFDIFMIMYLMNEINLSSDGLSYCVYESNWIEQTQSCKMCILILMERLKQPQELIVGKLYPLNLITFNSIVNGAYSMLNILQNLRIEGTQ